MNVESELFKCKNDIGYFAENYCYVSKFMQSPNKFIFKHNKLLCELIESFNCQLDKQIISILDRQTGKTTIAIVNIMHYMLFNKNKHVLFLFRDNYALIGSIEIIINMYLSLPSWMRVDIIDNKIDSMTLSNGNKLVLKTINNCRCIGCYNLIHIDEIGFCNSNQTFELFSNLHNLLPNNSNDFKLIIIGAPTNDNIPFYKLYKRSINLENNIKVISENMILKSNDLVEILFNKNMIPVNKIKNKNESFIFENII